MKRVAVVGFGFMGITHTLNILKNKDLRLVAIVDINPSFIEKKLIAREGNIATGNLEASDLSSVNKYSDLEECLHSEDLDAVNVCTHVDQHYTMTKKALLHNKHVFVEKPFCFNIKEGEELIQLAAERNKIIMVGQVVRFMPPYQKLKQWIDSKEFGALKFLSLSRFTGLPSWGQWKEKKASVISGGALFDLVVHDIDFVNYILGPPSNIKCNYLPGEFSKYDYVSALWKYNNPEVDVKIEGGLNFHSQFPFQAGYIARFEKASISFTSLKGDIIQIADNDRIWEVPAGDANEGYYNEIAYFAECMKNNTQPLECMPASSLLSVQLCYNHL